MNENRRQILDMLAAGKLTVEEAERLLAALDPSPVSVAGEFSGTTRGSDGVPVKTRAKYLRVLVEADESMTGMKGNTTVNVRVPMQLLRAGVRLASLIPAQAHEQLDEALSKHGVPIDAVADQAREPRGADRSPRGPEGGRGRHRGQRDQGAGVLRIKAVVSDEWLMIGTDRARASDASGIRRMIANR